MKRLLFTLPLLLAGCPTAVPVTPEALPPAPVQEATPPAPAAAVAPRMLAGTAELKGAPFAGATVKATVLGKSEIVATGQTASDGTFQLALPTSLKPGSLLQLTATRGKEALATLAATPAERQVQQTAEVTVVINYGTTVAVVVLKRELNAAGQAASAADADVDAIVRQITETFEAVRKSAEQSADRLAAEMEAEVLLAFSDEGSGELSEQDRDNLMRQAKDLVSAVREAVKTLTATSKTSTDSAEPASGGGGSGGGGSGGGGSTGGSDDSSHPPAQLGDATGSYLVHDGYLQTTVDATIIIGID